MRFTHGRPSLCVLVQRGIRFICSAHKLIALQHRRKNMVESRTEYLAVSTGVVLTAIVALFPLFA